MSKSFITAYKKGFSLIEIVMSLLILSGSIIVIFSGFDTSDKLNSYSSFESKATFLAERELELLKSDLLNKKRVEYPGTAESRFRLQRGWKVKTIWTSLDKTRVVRLISSVSHHGQDFKLESFLYLPIMGVKSAS